MCLFGRLVLFIGPWRAEPSSRQLESLGRGLSAEIFSNYLRVVRRRAFPVSTECVAQGGAKTKSVFMVGWCYQPLEG
ncbi:unnamed protein product [Ectocarpus sp. 8 AP-2014]